MTTVRQTVSTVQTLGSSPAPVGQLDNSLDALLEDLQTSVSHSPSANAMNGLNSSNTRTYREVTRTIQQDSNAGSPRDFQVQYLSAANPTTVVSERASSPMIPGAEQRSVAYKTVAYQYNTSDVKPVSGVLSDNRIISKSSVDTTSDAKLQQNLTELDSLLVDLHQAQKAGFGTPQGTTSTTRTEIVRTGIDPALLEAVEHISPSAPARAPQQHISRSVQYKYNTQQYNSDNSSPIRYQTDTSPSPRLQPKRSSSAQRELVYGANDSTHSRSTRSPSPMRQRDIEPPGSPRVPHRSVMQREVYYETKSNSSAPPATRSATMPHERYRDKSPSNQRLQQEMYYENKSATTNPSPSPQNRYRDMSPPSQRRGISPIRPAQNISPEPYLPQTDGSSRITTVRTYNYSTTGGTGPASPVSRSPYPGTSPSPIPVSRSPYPDSGVSIVEIPRTPHRSPSPSSYVTSQHTPGQPPTKVTTTVRTYTYELPGQPGVTQPPSGPPYDFGPGDRTLTYHVSPQQPILPKEREPLIPPQEPPPPTVITYKYSSHSSHSSNNKYPPEDHQPLLPRPFPTPSPTPPHPGDSQPPKRLDDLMASFSDSERDSQPPPGYYTSEKQVTSTHTQNVTPHGNGVAVVPPTSNTAIEAKSESVVKERVKTKNVAGPPVYYPPGVELFAKKEESMSMQSGKKAKGKYKYEYESESKSKSSSGGGAAVVPVCLPLCCAMPCVIL